MADILVVGAGMAGAVHARELAEAGDTVTVIDQRDHVGGNCFDERDETGTRVHRYGPHLFHTSNMAVVEWLSRFTAWTPYEHRVVAKLPDDRLVPLPVNLDTVNAVFGTALRDEREVAAFLATKAVDRAEIRSAEDWLYARMGVDLTELFFRPYTEKMWALKLAEVDPAIVKRVHIRTDREDRYFPGDSFQAMPTDGYTALFDRMLDHPRIEVLTSTAFDPSMLDRFDHCFNSMPIDVFFERRLGELPYRSIRFHRAVVPRRDASPHSVVNYTDAGRFTRETWWHNIPDHDGGGTHVVRTIEEPCDYRDNAMERYYPVKTEDGRYDALYRRYAELAATEPKVSFIGRCGTYQYLDMHQVVNQSLAGVRRWLSAAA